MHRVHNDSEKVLHISDLELGHWFLYQSRSMEPYTEGSESRTREADGSAIGGAMAGGG